MPDLQHLKRVRKTSLEEGGFKSTLLLSLEHPTVLPPNLPEPYISPVPTSPARNLEEVVLKSTIWPTVYQPRRVEKITWTYGRIRWIRAGIQRVVDEARRAKEMGEVPIASYVPDEWETVNGLAARDTRNSTKHPLRHSVMNLLRQVSNAQHSPPEPSDNMTRNGQRYLLTSRTLFTTHEPCIMCSMALLHSRVKDVFYIYPMNQTGGCGGLSCVPGLDGVNHRFSIWKWTSPVDFKDALEVDPQLDA
ncbi:cytidine deaminase-like protein [Sistotremastrum suecicum HHB10207 ss-3]|uniref:Cytidine deaminase-like protein n=1 Tax=Sistotremastrum suecicum HHB10207 ss-3 TaxID=1314776 RepID=A0A166HFM0_9AGAM|nr:cytidine deaminase-like protein [Sistotremastrum suecicum HHB10207 ss-3]